MEFQNDNVWLGVEDLTNDPIIAQNAKHEFHHTSVTDVLQDENAMGLQSNRRDFLKYLGFGISAATLAACEIPVRRVVPYVTKPDTIVPGVANYYASSFVDGGDYNAILVKTREGRPIKIEANTLSKVTPEGTSARAQAVVLSLYDTNRFKNAGKIEAGKFTATNWNEIDNVVGQKLSDPTAQIRVVTSTYMSPTGKAAMAEFQAKYPNAKIVTYDAVSYSAMLDANAETNGVRVLPSYKFDAASVIVSFDADFLGTWLSSTEYSAQYAKNRRVENYESVKMSRHIQVESRMSMTGSNADNRILVKPSEQGAAIAALYNAIAAKTGVAQVSAPAVNEAAKKALTKIADELVANQGKSLVVSGSNNKGEQVLVNAINKMLGSYGTTIDFRSPSYQRQGNDADITALTNELNAGSVAALFVLNCNPVHDLANGAAFKAGMEKTALTVSFAGCMDETTAACKYVAPANHLLESWGDVEAKAGHISLVQPTIRAIFQTRQAEHSLLKWAGSANLNQGAEQPYYEYLKANWQKSYLSKQSAFTSPQAFWDNAIHDGILEYSAAVAAGDFKAADVNTAASQITKPSASEWEIQFYESINVGDGRYANNPWLMEMPDPVMRTSWGNYLTIPVQWDGKSNYAAFEGLKDGDEVIVTVGGVEKKCAVVRQFGQMPGTASIALGYGRENGGAGTGVGTKVNDWAKTAGQTFVADATVKSTGKVEDHFAIVQYHHTMGVTGESAGYTNKDGSTKINVDEKELGPGYFEGALVKRSVIRRAELKDLKVKVEELVKERKEFDRLNKETLYPGHEDLYKAGPHWKMYVDLNSCTGCGSCTVACMSENNVPVVGKREVHRHHEMTWLRIDRYYYGDVNNPNAVYQPMMCQHCDNAPCENVCPVNATNHSHDGLNQMTYNRCIGTRYCANNCPYKVRRFNWLDYTTADLFGGNENYMENPNMNDASGKPFYADNLTRMVLNPDVTVRSRGVIEKCSFCVQRIQEGKLTAKRENREIKDADVKTACQTACPTGAITFGNGNDPNSTISKKINNPMNYLVLEEVNIAPNVNYSMKVVNKADLA
jgi:molybdopterin-containing oxidoreductase family iron-sulfur binding subunit